MRFTSSPSPILPAPPLVSFLITNLNRPLDLFFNMVSLISLAFFLSASVAFFLLTFIHFSPSSLCGWNGSSLRLKTSKRKTPNLLLLHEKTLVNLAFVPPKTLPPKMLEEQKILLKLEKRRRGKEDRLLSLQKRTVWLA